MPSFFNLAEYSWLAMSEQIQVAMRAYKEKQETILLHAIRLWTIAAIQHKEAPEKADLSKVFSTDIRDDIIPSNDQWPSTPWRGCDELRNPTND